MGAEFATQTYIGIQNGEELITLYRVFGYFYTEKDGQAWSPYLKRSIPCQIWNDNKSLSEKTIKECSIKSFNANDLKAIKINYSAADKVCLVVELQTCLVPRRVWDWARSIDKKKISKERKENHFAYENGGEDLDEYICNEVNYGWKSTGVAFRLDGSKLLENEMKELFGYFEWDTNAQVSVA